MRSFFEEENKILAIHQTQNVSLVFTLVEKGKLKNHYNLTAYVNGRKAMISDKEFLPNVYMGKTLFLEFSQFMHGSTSSLIERLKASCEGKGESLYRMALLLEQDSNAAAKQQSYKLNLSNTS